MNLLTHSVVKASQDRSRQGHAGADHQHLVEFYDSEEFLGSTVAGFVGPALNDGDAGIIVATEPHRLAFDTALRATGVDITSAASSDRYLVLDAARTLESIMVGGAPDPGRFAELARGVIRRAAAGSRRVHIYGEMVALLWNEGDIVSAIALEDLWNDLAAERDFTLLCAYPMRSFADGASVDAFKRICDRHSTVIPSEDYALVGDADAQQRVVAQLQQQNTALRAEVARLHEEGITANVDCAAPLAAVSQPREVRPNWNRPVPLPATSLTAGCRPASSLQGSPGGRLLLESVSTLSSRLRYAE